MSPKQRSSLTSWGLFLALVGVVVRDSDVVVDAVVRYASVHDVPSEIARPDTGQ
jgi:hypothetical protein